MNAVEVPLDLGTQFSIVLPQLWNNKASFTIDQFIAALEATTTLTDLMINARDYWASLDLNRRFIEPLCRCIANLRRRNPNHPLRTLYIEYTRNSKVLDQFLVAAKQFGIQCLNLSDSRGTIHSFVEFCRDNTHLRYLCMKTTIFSGGQSTSSVSSQPQESPVIITALDKLVIHSVAFCNAPTVPRQFLNFFAQHSTYSALELGTISMIYGRDDPEWEKKADITDQEIVSKLILQQSLEQLTLYGGFRLDAMVSIQACATVTQIEMSYWWPTKKFRTAVKQRKLQAIASRNRELARFVANPREYPGGDLLLLLMSQLDSSPTGRYMLVQGLVEIPSFFKINVSDSPTAGPKKKRKRY